MQKILFLDRDGCIIQEPQPDQQVDSLEKLEFLPGSDFRTWRASPESSTFSLVMVTNQDGLGTSSFPGRNLLAGPSKNVIKTLENEGDCLPQ
jgi:imidazoleglycerol-phosphate dehydratase/histidinol-phosphatase